MALNRYSYVLNNPLRYNDPSGHWLDTLIDIASIVYDVHDIATNGLNWENGLSLAADVVSLALPVVTGGGAMVRAAMHADDAVHVATHLDDAVRAAEHVDEATEALAHADEAAEVLLHGGDELAEKATVSLERFSSIGREGIPPVLEAFGDASRSMGEIPAAFESRRVTTLGRRWDIEAAKELGGFRVLDDPNWSIPRNYEWLMESVENGDVFYLASPVTEANLLGKAEWGGVSVYLRELDTLLQVGYRRIGDHLIPPR